MAGTALYPSGMPRLPGFGDLVGLLTAQAEALTALPVTLARLNRSLVALTRSIDEGRATLASVQRVAARAEALLDELAEPAAELRPGLRRLARLLDDPRLEQVPETVERLSQDLVPLVAGLQRTQAQMATLAAALPGASLLRWPRRASDPDDAL